MASLAGRNFAITFSDPWAAATDPRPDGRGQITTRAALPPPPSAHWEAPWGDRRTE